MIDNDLLKRLNAITQDPAWKEIIVARLAYIFEHTDQLFHKSKEDDFRYYQGRYDQAKEIYDLFKEPKNLVDDGVRNILPQPEKET
jgi:hypothetical protein